ncbi:MAG: hypothetical protein RLZZ293_536 [Pseudomonadota bacterium]|jgi:secreted trypsin-like serine protease
MQYIKLNEIIIINMLIILGLLSSCNSGGSRTNQVSNSLSSATKPQNSLVIKNGESVNIPELNALIPLIKVKTKHGYRLCTGVFLEPNKVLTAGHCIIKLHYKAVNQYYVPEDVYPPERVSVMFPKNLIKPINYGHDKSRHWTKYPVQAVYVKLDVFAGINILSKDLTIYDYEKINDLAIIELSKAPKYKFHMQLASVAPEIGTEQIVVGFGYNNGKNAKNQAESNTDDGLIRMAKTIVSNITRVDRPRTLRIGGAVTDNDPDIVACKGDSGAPSLSYNESSLSYIVTGIRSLGYGVGLCSFLPDVYMSVAHYKDWIESGYLTDSLRIGKFPNLQ